MTPLGRVCLMIAAALVVTDVALAHSMDHGSLEQLFGEPVTASATGAPQRESQVPATMEIITAAEIRRSGARDIPGVLRHTVGQATPETGRLVPIPAWVAVDGRLAYRVTPRATLALAVETLNRSTQRRTSAAEIERSVVASLTVEF